MTHVGFNAKGFKQSFMYVSELLSHADTVGITETWLRPGELSVIKPTLLGSPALKEYSSLQENPYNVRYIHTVLIVHIYIAPLGVDNV